MNKNSCMGQGLIMGLVSLRLRNCMDLFYIIYNAKEGSVGGIGQDEQMS